MPEKLIIYTDGGARGNPGPAAAGGAIYARSGKLIEKFSKYLGERTNNEAEYEAIILALEKAARQRAAQVRFYMDSELVARQLSGIYRVRERRLAELLLKVRNLETNFQKVSFTHVPREKNRVADRLVNECLDERVSRLRGK
ncbi:MAG: ribonuclease HI family protein [Candidatus Doudnabacteria bacterium]|nr:ribonuclease HI family protein [Candidatus Doudnabacteria bacterium]